MKTKLENISPDRARMIRGFLDSFHSLDRASIDEEAWIALKLSCSREEAAREIEQTNRLLPPTTAEKGHP